MLKSYLLVFLYLATISVMCLRSPSQGAYPAFSLAQHEDRAGTTGRLLHSAGDKNCTGGEATALLAGLQHLQLNVLGSIAAILIFTMASEC